MDQFARLADAERRDVFLAASGPRRSSAIVEKDFWVVWTLRHLSSLDTQHPQFIFKGGTSLSKGYGAIARFSEDVDLGIHRSWFGFDDAVLLGSGRSRKKAIDALAGAVASYIERQLHPALEELSQRELNQSGLFAIDARSVDRQTLLFNYPSVTSRSEYVENAVRIELGGRSDHEPHDVRTITPYVSDKYPGLFSLPSVSLDVLDAKRTFWEKATILHNIAHLSPSRLLPSRYARHYYDLSELTKLNIGMEAVKDTDLLHAVANHKRYFFPDTRARSSDPLYEQARPGTLRLIPGPERLAEVVRDYEAMEEMFLEDPPQFEVILQNLRQVEALINATAE
jgi:nucleotidyltransferase AbiEii toxin of type IV toxin-antitoxin system